MQALFEYKENLPSLNSTIDGKQERDSDLMIDPNGSKDRDLKDVLFTLDKIEDNKNEQLFRASIPQRLSNVKDYLETIEENEISESDCESIHKATNYESRTAEVTSVYSKKASKSIYATKTKITKVQKRPMSAQYESKIPKMRRQCMGSPKLLPKTKSCMHQKTKTMLRMPTPTKTCKFMNSYKSVRILS